MVRPLTEEELCVATTAPTLRGQSPCHKSQHSWHAAGHAANTQLACSPAVQPAHSDTQRHAATDSDTERQTATRSLLTPTPASTSNYQHSTPTPHAPHPAPSTQHPTRANLALSPPVRPRPSSRKIFFEKLSKYIGRGIKALLDRPDGLYCFRLHRDRVYYMSEAQATPQPLRHSHCEP